MFLLITTGPDRTNPKRDFNFFDWARINHLDNPPPTFLPMEVRPRRRSPEVDLRSSIYFLIRFFFSRAAVVVGFRPVSLPAMPLSLLYFNSLFGAIAMSFVVRTMPGEWNSIVNFQGWRNSTFIALYLCTSFMGERERGRDHMARELPRPPYDLCRLRSCSD